MFRKILNTLSFKVASKILPKKGNLVYEYNPFRNYRLTEDMFEYKGRYYTYKQLLSVIKKEINVLNLIVYEKTEKEVEGTVEETYTEIEESYLDKCKQWDSLYLLLGSHYVPLFSNTNETPLLHEAGELVDFITDELSFDLEHPVNILPLYSYDDSVNLILNDGKNKPRLINSRFSAVGRNKYLIVDRKGNYDTNIYNLGNKFDIDTSLYKLIVKIPKLQFLGTIPGGNMSVGNYHFYFRYLDADGNQSDFVAESGLVSIFIGLEPSCVRSGFRNENSYKVVRFVLSNIDPSYQQVQVYYTKATSDIYENSTTSAFLIDLTFNINALQICNLNITGFENTIEVPLTDINPFYLICDNVSSLTICLNMLFLANIQKPEIDYEDLSDVSLYFLPYLGIKPYDYDLDVLYNTDDSKKGYTDSLFIYNFTGYWDLEIYRLGIVYILSDNTLSPVFNIRGAENVGVYNKAIYSEFDFSKSKVRTKITVSEDNLIVSDTLHRNFENSKGVITFQDNFDKSDTTPSNKKIYGIDIRVDNSVLSYLKEECGIKGFFFVRQKRIPITLCLALTIGIDKESHTPVLPISPSGLLIESITFDDVAICRNKKTGEIVRGDTLVKIPKGFLASIASVAIASVAIASLPIMMGIPLGTAATIYGGVKAIQALNPGYTFAYILYKDDKDWEVYYPLQKPEGDICYVSERFLTDSKQLKHEFNERLYFLSKNNVNVLAVICPDYDVNSAYYNNIFVGDTISFKYSTSLPTNEYLNYDTYNERHFYNDTFVNEDDNLPKKCKILGVEDNAKLVGIDDIMFSARAGEAEESFRYEYIEKEQKLTSSFNLLRGSFGPYVAITGNLLPNKIIDIKIPGYNENNLEDYFKIRFEDKSSFYAISDRIDINDLDYWFKKTDGEATIITSDYAGELQLKDTLYRGDCYICLFTHRLNRNFQDPSAPTNDKIVDPKCWALNYEFDDGVIKSENFDKINLGDVNAIQLGMWVTSTYRSSRNLNIRNTDDSIPDEVSLIGHSRGYYPYLPMSASGTYKTPEALCYNAGFEKSVSERHNFETPDVPAIKNNFATRILYSDILISDAFKNGFRVFQGSHYRDYPITYGSITKLIELQGNLICVFEHGIALIPVNERAVAGEGAGGNVYINTSNVLPENPNILSGTYGSLWADSIIKTTEGNIYGVDTVAKKIWAITSNGFLILSDFVIQEFLNNNISLTERELTPIVGIRNVKTHYNAFKHDVMFTFYDNTYGFEEKCWNLCYNEILNKFITFYSWIPSFSENIYNTYFSFDRNTSKWIAKLGLSKSENLFKSTINIDNTTIYSLITDTVIGNSKTTGEMMSAPKIGELSVSKDTMLEGKTGIIYDYSYSIEYDSFGNYKYFDILYDNTLNKHFLVLKDRKYYNELCTELYVRDSNPSVTDNKDNHGVTPPDLYIKPLDENGNLKENWFLSNYSLAYDETKRRIWLDSTELPNKGRVVIYLNIKVLVTAKIPDGHISIKEMEEYVNSYNDNYSTYNAGYFECVLALIPEYNQQFLTTDFWKHGLSGIIDLKDTIKPTHWYGKQHPFEFEFVVADNPDKHKIFDSLEILSNKAEPESFHYEIVGECYDFAKDKENMYIRQEATKELYQYNGSDITFDRDYKNLKSYHRPYGLDNSEIPRYYDKSTIFPLYYRRNDTINEVEDSYHLYTDDKENPTKFANYAGAEIVRYENLDEYRIWNHAKAVDIREHGLLKGNMLYKEDKWDILINPLNFVLNNESLLDWENKYRTDSSVATYDQVPAELNLFKEIKKESIGKDESNTLLLPNDWTRNVVSWNTISDDGYYYQTENKEAKMKDKFIKIRIRYSGKELAVISAVKTLYSISFA